MKKYLLVVLLMQACVKPNCTALREADPKSIVIMPSVNITTEISADTKFMTTVSEAFAERGYYVFPVAVVDTFLKSQGVETGDQARAIPLEKVRTIFGADAVLYTTIKQWATKYMIFDSQVVVEASYELVDARSGNQLWQYSEAFVESLNRNSNSGLIADAVAAAVSAVASANTDAEIGIAYQLNTKATQGLSFGERRGGAARKYDNETGCAF